MNRNLKKIISVIVAVGIFSAITPITKLNLMTTKAYADESDGVTSIEMETTDGDKRDLYDDSDCGSSDEIDGDELKAGETYYATAPSDSIEINVDGVDSDCIRIFGGDSSSDEGEREGSSIDLSTGTTTIKVRIYSEDPGKVEESDDSYISEYKFKVKYRGSDEDDDESDNVYLKTLDVSYADIEFAKRTYTYDATVPEDCSKITVRARPNCDNDEYDDYKVKINGVKVDDEDKFKDDVKINKGKNVIEITVEDDDDNQRIYTLNITRGDVAESNNSNSNNVSTNIKINQWIQVNGKWQYNDATGKPVKNTWIQNYYLQDNGDMATGWINYGGSWYYLGSDGFKKTGWQSINGRWYYLNSFGAMAYNTTIDGYKLGVDGTWTGK